MDVNIALLAGDGIGPEIIAEARKYSTAWRRNSDTDSTTARR